MISSRPADMLAIAFAAAVLSAGHTQAAPIAYPFKGQSAQQQQLDDGECYVWSKSTTGVDPVMVAGQTPTPSGPAIGGGERVKGAIGGAIIGGLVGDRDDARKGAVIGTLAGGARARRNQRAQQDSYQDRKQGQLDSFYRAYSACMEGRGYTVR